MILDIRVLGDPILREETKPVKEVTGVGGDEIRQLVRDMFETMYAAGGIGIAAPQVGRSERIFVIDIDDKNRYVFINPEIVERSGNEKDEEGCLSIPDISGEVDRSLHVTARALDENGEPFEVEASGLFARCIQHELDHLDGKLFIDYLGTFKRRAALAAWEEEKGKYPGFIRKIDPKNPQKRRTRKTEDQNHTEPEM